METNAPAPTVAMLSEDGVTYPGASSAFRNWQPENSFLYELLFAGLTTCLVYQLTKIVLDVGLGQRTRGEILITDLNQFIQVSNFSFRSILSSFGCKGSVVRRRFHGKVASCPAETHLEKSIKVSVVAKYLLLLLAAPVIHMVGIYLSVEGEKVVSFGDVRFGGVALGISEKGDIFESHPGSFCPPARTKYARGETPLANFYRCFGFGDFPHDNDFANDTFVLMLRGSWIDMGFTIVSPSRRWVSFVYLDMHTGETPYRLRNTVSYNEFEQMFERGLAQMMAVCPSGLRSNVNSDEYIPPAPGQWVVSAKAQCKNYRSQQIEGIATSMLNNVSMVDTDEFEVSRFANETFSLGDDLDLLVRRSSTATFLSMLIAAAIAIIVRLIINLVFNNDAHLAVEAILKDRLGMKCCDSMLQAENLVHFKNEIEFEDAEFEDVCAADDGKKLSCSLDDDMSNMDSY